MGARITGGEALKAHTSLPQSKAQTRCTVPNSSGVPELECRKGSINGGDGENADNEYHYWLGTIT